MENIAYASCLQAGDWLKIGDRWHVLVEVAHPWHFGELLDYCPGMALNSVAIDGYGITHTLPIGLVTAFRDWQATEAWNKATDPTRHVSETIPYRRLFTEITGIRLGLTYPKANTQY